MADADHDAITVLREEAAKWNARADIALAHGQLMDAQQHMRRANEVRFQALKAGTNSSNRRSDAMNDIMDQMACAQQFVGQSPEPPQPPLSKLYAALERLFSATVSTASVADRLCGAVPGAAGDAAKIQGEGVFSEIETIASQINELVDGINFSVGRIQGRL